MPSNQRKEKIQDHATYPIPSHLGLLEVFNKPFCIMEGAHLGRGLRSHVI
jgi:hypothetical protein